MNQWIADVQADGLQVVFTADGSAQGRQDFANDVNDFAVSEIGFQGVDAQTGASDTSDGRDYAYLPLVAGGTSFPYQVRVHGQLLRTLRLSGLTLAKIFTNQITNWDDPEITQDNNGVALPSLPIIPVVPSEGSGTSAHFSDYLSLEFPSLWQAYSHQSGLTEYYPTAGNMIAQDGSDQVMNYVDSAAANGAIGLDEYSYALGADYPVALVENSAGFFTLPTQYNVAVALTAAAINNDPNSPNYLLQNLSAVYTNNDPRTYPLSSYSYMIIPTSPTDPRMTTAKRQTLADFTYYDICNGQKEVGPIGYSPLPINLVEAGFGQIAKLQQADPNVDLTQRNVSTCNNPTFVANQPSVNYLAQIAPEPPSCDKAGLGPCVAGGPTQTNAAPAVVSKSGAATGTSGGTAAKGGASTGTGTGTGTGAGGTTAATTANGDPVTVVPGADPSGSGGGTQMALSDLPSRTTSDGSADVELALAGLAIALVLFLVIAPPLLIRLFGRRSSGRT